MTKTTRRSLIAIGIAIILALLGFAAMPKMSASAEESSTIAANADFGGGSGTLADPYLIYNETQLNNIRKLAYWDYLDSCYRIASSFKLATSIILKNTWSPIAAYFDGTFYGEGYSISDLRMEVNGATEIQYYGLFEKIGSGTVENLTMPNISVTYPAANTNSNIVYIGGIAGRNLGIIENCKVSGSLEATYLYNADIGGITGSNDGIIRECTNHASINGSGSIGGIAGASWSAGNISYCTNHGSINYRWRDESRYAGGIVGSNRYGASVTYCTNYGNIAYVGPWTLLKPRACMAQIIGWLQKGTCEFYTLEGTCDYSLLHGNQLMYCSDGAIGKKGD